MYLNTDTNNHGFFNWLLLSENNAVFIVFLYCFLCNASIETVNQLISHCLSLELMIEWVLCKFQIIDMRMVFRIGVIID